MKRLALLALILVPLLAMAGVVGGPNDHMGHSGMGMPEINVKTIPPAVKGYSELRVMPFSDIGAASDIGAWRTTCTVAKVAFIDPIVFPRQADKSHLHTLFGNTGITANSTAASLSTSGGSTCFGGIGNRSAYWVPSMVDTSAGAPVMPQVALIYYKQGYLIKDSKLIQPVPFGLKMLAGTAKNSADVWLGGKEKWHYSPYVWKCMSMKLGYSLLDSQQIETCPAGTDQLWMTLGFPQCLAVDAAGNPVLDSPDHKGHLSHPENGACPASHPMAIPELSYQVEYLIPPGTDTGRWRLSSDMYDEGIPGGRSAHGDYMMAWPPLDKDESGVARSFMETFVKNCVQQRKDCHNNLLGDGRILY